jgi:hypothetical protein
MYCHDYFRGVVVPSINNGIRNCKFLLKPCWTDEAVKYFEGEVYVIPVKFVFDQPVLM